MQKVLFDPEDFPPPSYYLGHELDDERRGSEERTLHKNDSWVERSSSNFLENLQSQGIASVHQTTKTVANDPQKSTGVFDKSEWWKAPEFIPRTRDGSYTAQQKSGSPALANRLDTPQTSGSANEISVSSHQISLQQSLAHQQPQSHPGLCLKTIPVAHQRMPMAAPFPLSQPGLCPATAPFIPLPLSPAMAGWPAPNPAPFNAAALTALQNQLARVYSHNPRVVRGPHEMPAAVYNQKLQQLILQQQNHIYRNHHPKVIPFTPAALEAPGRKGSGIPTGYKANMTTIDAGLGRAIPAIVLKRKRKKKNKKAPATECKGQDPFLEVPAKNGEDDATKENGVPLDEEEEDDETTTSSLTSPALAESRRSAPDLTKIPHEPNLLGEREHSIQQSCYCPNDLELIQSSSHCAMITGSCPDLSTDIELIADKRDMVSAMTVSHHENPFLRDSEVGTNQNDPGNYFINDYQTDKQSAYGFGDFELDTNPVVKNAMRDLASEGMIKSEQVKELNRQVVKDMKLEEKLRQWRDDDLSEPDLDEEDTIFERLLKHEDARQKTAKKQQFETNPGKGQKSLREELEEGLMAFRNRGGRDYDLVPQREEDAMEKECHLADGLDSFSRAAVHHTAIVHNSRKHGELARTELFNEESKDAKRSLIPRATYVEEDMEEERLRITVNALDALDVDGADTSLAKSHLRSLAANDRGHSSENIAHTKRRLTFPDAVPLVPFVRSRNCCALM